MISIFSAPTKNNIKQRNAVNSWLSLRVDQEVILFGEKAKEIAASTGAFHVENNLYEYGKRPIFLFCDPEVIIFDSLVAAVCIIEDNFTDGYLVIGGVTKLNTKEEINFNNEMWDLDLIRDARTLGKECDGIGYYAFPKGLYDTPCSPGRGMIDYARDLPVPVIDITRYAPTVYQGTVSPPQLLDLSTHILTARGIIELRR